MKYRRLRKFEIRELEPEFRQFLVARNITSKEWQVIKDNDNHRLFELVDLFSDQVFEKALKKVKFLEHRSPKDLMVFECNGKGINMIGLVVEMQSDIDFTNPECMTALVRSKEEDLRNTLTVYRSTKEYHQSREMELFYLLESGCRLSTEATFTSMKSLAEMSSQPA